MNNSYYTKVITTTDGKQIEVFFPERDAGKFIYHFIGIKKTFYGFQALFNRTSYSGYESGITHLYFRSKIKSK